MMCAQPHTAQNQRRKFELGYYDDYEIDNEGFKPSERLDKISKAFTPKYKLLKDFVKKTIQ